MKTYNEHIYTTTSMYNHIEKWVVFNDEFGYAMAVPYNPDDSYPNGSIIVNNVVVGEMFFDTYERWNYYIEECILDKLREHGMLGVVDGMYFVK